MLLRENVGVLILAPIRLRRFASWPGLLEGPPELDDSCSVLLDGPVFEFLPLISKTCFHLRISQLLVRIFNPRRLLYQLVLHHLGRLPCCLPGLNPTEKLV